jgi:uncharacterized protein
MTIRFVVVALLAIACRRDSAPTTTGSAERADPWAAPAVADELPDTVATKALADKACPRVVAPYYFRIIKDGKTSFMLGTRHLGVPLTKLPTGVKDQLTKATLVVFETPPGDDAPATDRPPKGPPLPEQLGDQMWGKYKSLVGEQTASSLENATPAVALIALMMLYEDKLSALDVEIEQAVTEAKIDTGGLETSAFQDRLLEELLDLRMLKATLAGTKDRKQLEKESMDDLAEYCRGTDNDPGMDERTKKVLAAGGYSDVEIKKLDERLLDERNTAWIPQLEKLFAKGNVFVVVGADHLIGPQGVIKTLESKGYQTTRLSN